MSADANPPEHCGQCDVLISERGQPDNDCQTCWMPFCADHLTTNTLDEPTCTGCVEKANEAAWDRQQEDRSSYVPTEQTASYRDSMRDAGRGRLL